MVLPRTDKRILVISDGHAGHRLGLTPPGFDSDGEPARKPIHWKMRRYIWDWFTKKVASLGKIDILLYNGDAVDGKGQKSGGTEQTHPDRVDQVEMAVATINHIGAGVTFMSYGTGYHTGTLEDWEDLVALQAKNVTKIGSEDNIEVNEVVINYRHHVGRSTIPHGRHTPVAKEKLWNDLWAQRGEYPSADILIRSHVHYYTFCGDAGWVAVTTPALQGYGSKHGARRMTGTVDAGMLVIDISKEGRYKWVPLILRFPLHLPISL